MDIPAGTSEGPGDDWDPRAQEVLGDQVAAPAPELATIATGLVAQLSVGTRPVEVQQLLRTQPELRQAAMDEMLRLEPPLIANRRRTTAEVEVSGRTIPADAAVSILWPAAQRDPRAFPDPTSFRLDRDPELNLLYDRGPHYCPGESLSRLQLGLLLEALLARIPPFHLAGPPVRASYPSGGFKAVPIDWPRAGGASQPHDPEVPG